MERSIFKINWEGFGITTLMQISTAAFVGSWCNSLCKISQRFPSRADLCGNLINYASPPFYQHLCEAVASLPAAVALDGEALTPETFSGLIANPVKLQNCLSSDIAEESAATCIRQTSLVKHAARIRSCQGRGAGLWLQAVPSAPKFVVKCSEFRVTSFLRLGISLPYLKLLPKCDCNASLDEHGTIY